MRRRFTALARQPPSPRFAAVVELMPGNSCSLAAATVLTSIGLASTNEAPRRLMPIHGDA